MSKLVGLALDHLVGEADEGPDAGGGEQHRHQRPRLDIGGDAPDRRAPAALPARSASAEHEDAGRMQRARPPGADRERHAVAARPGRGALGEAGRGRQRHRVAVRAAAPRRGPGRRARAGRRARPRPAAGARRAPGVPASAASVAPGRRPPSRVNGPGPEAAQRRDVAEAAERRAEVAGEAADVAALAAGHLQDGGVAVGDVDELQPLDVERARRRGRAPRRRGRSA